MNTVTPVLTTEQQIEEHRKWWAELAKENGWYKQPFFIQVWVDRHGEVTDSVTYDSLTQDFVLETE